MRPLSSDQTAIPKKTRRGKRGRGKKKTPAGTIPGKLHTPKIATSQPQDTAQAAIGSIAQVGPALAMKKRKALVGLLKSKKSGMQK